VKSRKRREVDEAVDWFLKASEGPTHPFFRIGKPDRSFVKDVLEKAIAAGKPTAGFQRFVSDHAVASDRLSEFVAQSFGGLPNNQKRTIGLQRVLTFFDERSRTNPNTKRGGREVQARWDIAEMLGLDSRIETLAERPGDADEIEELLRSDDPDGELLERLGKERTLQPMLIAWNADLASRPKSEVVPKFTEEVLSLVESGLMNGLATNGNRQPDALLERVGRIRFKSRIEPLFDLVDHGHLAAMTPDVAQMLVHEFATNPALPQPCRDQLVAPRVADLLDQALQTHWRPAFAQNGQECENQARVLQALREAGALEDGQHPNRDRLLPFESALPAWSANFVNTRGLA
jgi:hypothetical protein